MGKPDHQQFEVGPFIIYSHDYDGDVLTVVKDEPDPLQPGCKKGFAIREPDLVRALEMLEQDVKKHVPLVMP